MNFVIMFLMSLGSLIVTRIFFTLVCNLQENENEVLFRFAYSVATFFVFIGIWGVAMLWCFGTKPMYDNLIWYVVLTFFGSAAIIWCYFRWDLKWKARPKLEDDRFILALKKTFVFVAVMGFAFYHGYMQMDAILKGVQADSTLNVYNVTLITGIIALDRVLNQATSAYKEWKETTKRENN